MVTINYEPLEHLPHIDENISPEERSHVEQLIRLELANQFNNNIQHITHNDQVMANPNILLEQQQQNREKLIIVFFSFQPKEEKQIEYKA